MTMTLDGTAGMTAPQGAVYNGLQMATAQASTSGTSIDFTGIPIWAKRVTVILSGVSTSGGSTLRVQIGSGSVNTTADYNFGGIVFASGTAVFSSTASAGFDIESSSGVLTASAVRYGSLTLLNISGNNWVLTYNAGYSGVSYYASGAGNKSLPGILDRVRITTANGTDTFDAGSINIMYE